MEVTDTALLILRLWLATVMLAHGIHHARTIEGTAKWFESKGFRQAKLQATLSGVNEIAIAGALAVGFLTTFAAAGLVATMFVAFWTVHRPSGFFVYARPDEGWEYVATLGVASVVLAALGPGEASVDAAIGIAENLDGWLGGAIALAGVLAAAGQLAIFWRKPDPT